MIHLFDIPKHTIDTSRFSNMLSDKVVREFEEKFAAYVGADYAVSVSSATAAIFLIFLEMEKEVTIPSIMPPVVANALKRAGCSVMFEDDISWVGGSYVMHQFGTFKVIDSAHRVDRDQFKKEASENDLMIFSFYPTKPVSGCDGGMIVSNNKDHIDYFRLLANNGMDSAENNWDRQWKMAGFKMYMNSIQACIALKNFDNLELKKERLARIRGIYNSEFGLRNTSDHLYRVDIDSWSIDEFVKASKEVYGVVCGIHYKPLHLAPWLKYDGGVALPLSEEAGRKMVSIPFHENLTNAQILKVIELIDEHR